MKGANNMETKPRKIIPWNEIKSRFIYKENKHGKGNN